MTKEKHSLQTRCFPLRLQTVAHIDIVFLSVSWQMRPFKDEAPRAGKDSNRVISETCSTWCVDSWDKMQQGQAVPATVSLWKRLFQISSVSLVGTLPIMRQSEWLQEGSLWTSDSWWFHNHMSADSSFLLPRLTHMWSKVHSRVEAARNRPWKINTPVSLWHSYPRGSHLWPDQVTEVCKRDSSCPARPRNTTMESACNIFSFWGFQLLQILSRGRQ